MNKNIEELYELAAEAIGYVSPYFREKWDMDNRLETLRTSISEQPHWIPCNEQNPPPSNTPMLLWIPRRQLTDDAYIPGYAISELDCYTHLGEPGKDFTFYMFIGEPE